VPPPPPHAPPFLDREQQPMNLPPFADKIAGQLLH